MAVSAVVRHEENPISWVAEDPDRGPPQIDFVDQLPRTETGRLFNKKLIAEYAGRRA